MNRCPHGVTVSRREWEGNPAEHWQLLPQDVGVHEAPRESPPILAFRQQHSPPEA